MGLARLCLSRLGRARRCVDDLFFFSFHDFSQHILTKYVYTYIAPSLFIIPITPLLSVIHFVNILLPLSIRQRLTANLFSFHAIHLAFPLFFSLLPYPTSSPTPKKNFPPGERLRQNKNGDISNGHNRPYHFRSHLPDLRDVVCARNDLGAYCHGDGNEYTNEKGYCRGTRGCSGWRC